MIKILLGTNFILKNVSLQVQFDHIPTKSLENGYNKMVLGVGKLAAKFSISDVFKLQFEISKNLQK